MAINRDTPSGALASWKTASSWCRRVARHTVCDTPQERAIQATMSAWSVCNCDGCGDAAEAGVFGVEFAAQFDQRQL
jgi:hypothetical protein